MRSDGSEDRRGGEAGGVGGGGGGGGDAGVGSAPDRPTGGAQLRLVQLERVRHPPATGPGRLALRPPQQARARPHPALAQRHRP